MQRFRHAQTDIEVGDFTTGKEMAKLMKQPSATATGGGAAPPAHPVSSAGRALTDVLPAAAAFAAREFIPGPLVTEPRRVRGALARPVRRSLAGARRGVPGAL